MDLHTLIWIILNILVFSGYREYYTTLCADGILNSSCCQMRCNTHFSLLLNSDLEVETQLLSKLSGHNNDYEHLADLYNAMQF